MRKQRQKPNKKTPIITGVIALVVISFIVMSASDTTTIQRVKFSNQNIVISQGNAGNISNTDVGIGNQGGISNQNVGSSNQNVNIGNTGSGVGNQNVGFGNQGDVNNQNVGFGNQGDVNNQNVGFGNQSGNIGNVGGEYGNTGVGYGNSGVGMGHQGLGDRQPDRYRHLAVDWSEWKSNFVNRILDDSMYIKSLDTYGLGTWFYYSFVVTKSGNIRNVTVFSLYLKKEDKEAIRNMIGSYAHQPITEFPPNTRRRTAKVKAIMLLGDTESKSDASNFNDVEKIRIKY